MVGLTSEQKKAVKEASHEVLAEATAFLQSLVRIDTTNPPGYRYREIAQLMADHLTGLGYESKLLTVDQADLAALAPHDPAGHERVNIIGKRKSASKSPAFITTPAGVKREKTIHFNGHTDVVPIGDRATWKHDPFGAEIEDGVMYGRGVSDMKGGIAAGVWAAEAVKRAGLVLRGTVEQSGCVDEESTGVRNAGLGWLVEEKHICPETTDAVVITEPLNVENLCLGHRGAIWGTLTFRGVASHGATPQRGINALVHAATFVVRASEKINSQLSNKFDDRVIPPEARGASLTFSVLQSGANTNSVPDLAILRFDRRLVPSETLEEARFQIQEVLDQLVKEIPEVKYELKEDYHTEPIWIDEDQEICKAFKDGIQSALGVEAGIVCSPGSDDQRFAVRGGISQTIVYGPGNIRNVHNKDEALSLEDLRASIEVMAVGMCEFLGVD